MLHDPTVYYYVEGAGDAEYLTRLTQLTKGLPPSLMTYGATTVFQTEVD